VRLVILDEGDACCLRIYDQGGGFRPEQVHLPDAETKNGRGVCLMRHCTEGLRYNAAEGFLEMRMRRAPV
jgi:anti-sigma regulatory factor (Ser/Thr protein kinase)